MNILKQEGIIMEHVKFVNMVTEAICKLEAQGELSKEDIGSGCHYRMNKGDKTLCCIVGHMMPDDTNRYHADIRYVGDSCISTLYEKDFYLTKKFTKDQICVLD